MDRRRERRRRSTTPVRRGARVAKEWKAFVDGTAGDGVDAVNEKLAELGAGWNVVVVKDLDAVSAVFAEYSTK